MKKHIFLLMMMFLCGELCLFAQNKIDLTPATKHQETTVSLNGFHTVFTYNNINAEKISNDKGEFSLITIDGTYPSGKDGQAQLPSTHKLLLCPAGSTPEVTVTSYSTKEYNLKDYGIGRLYPRQPSERKDTKPEDRRFVYDEAAYAQKGYTRQELVTTEIIGKIRGIQVVSVNINPVAYDPTQDKIRVYNDIDVTIDCKGDTDAMKKTLIDSYSPYFKGIYQQFANASALGNVYDEHPDLYNTPVSMLVVANEKFKETIQPWLEWKTQKGFYLEVGYTDEIGVTNTKIKSWILDKYENGVNGVKPSFLVIFGDKAEVAPSENVGSASDEVTDLYYSSVDGDYFPDIFTSRMSASSVSDMKNIVDKVLVYEKYTMPDDSYLNNALLIGGYDDYWTDVIGKPTIEYATTNYFNTEHGLTNVWSYTNPYTNCYTHLNNVGLANYTAHGGEDCWYDPNFSNSDVSSLTNKDKYFVAIGNCCVSGKWGYATCFGEALTRAKEKGAFAYIGSCPNTYWLEDYYFGVGAINGTSATPTPANTSAGMYDGYWNEETYNTVNSMVFIGNLAVCYAHDHSYETHSSPLYYWQAYHVLGDGSVMPYRTAAKDNTVTHLPVIPLGTTSFEVNTTPGSLVAISVDGVLRGTAVANEAGVANVILDPITSPTDAMIVVTRPQYKPYINTIPCQPLDGVYITIDSFNPSGFHVGEELELVLSMKNVGNQASTSNATVTISCDDPRLTIIKNTSTCPALESDEIKAIEPLLINIAQETPDATTFTVHVTTTYESETYENNIVITTEKALFSAPSFKNTSSFEPGETKTLQVTFENVGHYQAKDIVIELSSTNQYIKIEEPIKTIESIDINSFAWARYTYTIDASCPSEEVIMLNCTLTDGEGNVSTGTLKLSNSCKVMYHLTDDWGDSWNGAKLKVEYDGHSETFTLTDNDHGEKIIEREYAKNKYVSLRWLSGSYDSECAFDIYYEDGTEIFQSPSTLSEGLLGAFKVDCGGQDIKPGVQNLVGEFTDNHVVLTWDSPSSRAVTYEIYRNGSLLGTTVSRKYVDNFSIDGTYQYAVVAVYYGGTSSMAELVEVIISHEGLDDLSLEEINIFPNPASDMLNIRFNRSFDYIVYDALGRMMTRATVASGHATINTSSWNNGIYFLKIISGEDTITKKILVK